MYASMVGPADLLSDGSMLGTACPNVHSEFLTFANSGKDTRVPGVNCRPLVRNWKISPHENAVLEAFNQEQDSLITFAMETPIERMRPASDWVRSYRDEPPTFHLRGQWYTTGARLPPFFLPFFLSPRLQPKPFVGLSPNFACWFRSRRETGISLFQ